MIHHFVENAVGEQMIVRGRDVIDDPHAVCARGEPWYNCESCRRTSGYAVSLRNMSVQPDDYLPPMEEVSARRDEEARNAGGTRTVEEF